MSKKIFHSIFSVSLIVILISLILFVGIFHNYISSIIDIHLKDEANIIISGTNTSGMDFFSELEKNNIRSKITLIDEYGNAIFDNSGNLNENERYYLSEEVKEALVNGEGYSSKESSILRGSTKYYAVFIPDYHVLRLSINQYSLFGLLMDNSAVIIIILALLVICSYLMAKDRSLIITKPINDIDLITPEVPKDYDEIVPLISKINEQNAKIQDQIDELKYQRDEFAIITSNMQEGIIVISSDMKILSINDRAIKLFGHKNSYYPGERISDLNIPNEFILTLEESLNGECCDCILEIGDTYHEMISNPIFNSDGSVVGSAVIVLNITQKIENENMRREFTSNVSHELKTPLTHIFGFSEMISQGLVKQEDIMHFAQIIKDESLRMMSLIDNIIKLSRLDERKVTEYKCLVDLYGIATNVINRFSHTLRNKNITVTLQGTSTLVNGVGSLLEEVIQNIVDNAIKYNVDGGEINIQIHKKQNSAYIIVSDTGIGISNSDQERIFERFYRVDKSHSQAVPGSGLGLSIVKRAVSYHGGTVTVDSEIGNGTTVTVCLPIKKDEKKLSE